MAYRTFKRVLGETSLERKCRFLFGASLLLLIVGGFSLFSDQNKRLISENTRSNCRYLVDALLLKIHFEKLNNNDEFVGAATLPAGEHHELAKDISSNIGSLRYSGKFLSLTPTDSTAVSQPESQEEEFLLVRLRDEYQAQLAELARLPRPQPKAPTDGDPADGSDEASTAIYETYRDLPPKEADILSESGDEYFYYQAVQWKTSCVACHLTIYGISPQVADGETQTHEEMALALPFRAVKVELPYRITRRGINRIYSILLATGIITVFLSMIALYIVVRYVIVKPLQHLQHVSEEVERGNYGARAQIETNDEFEQLAESFNRMLGHLVDAQDQLQGANSSLDAKVDQLAQANMQLYESNRVKSNFLANVSHELRTPLNSIIGFSDVLQGIDALNDKQKRYVSNISNSGRVLLDMINDILDLAKMESGKMDVRGSTFSIVALVKAQCDLVAGLADEKNIDLTVDAPDGLPEIFQDQPKVQQILTNLLSNAIKFTPEGGLIRVIVDADSRENPRCLVLTVDDTGVGIAEEDREVIFEKFRQATASRTSDNLTREFSGTGLGLSIVKELCKMLGGEVTFTSELGQGSAFTVRLPWQLRTEATDDNTGPLEADEWRNSGIVSPAKMVRPTLEVPAVPDESIPPDRVGITGSTHE